MARDPLKKKGKKAGKRQAPRRSAKPTTGQGQQLAVIRKKGPKAQGARSTPNAMMIRQALDARFQHHVPPPLCSGKYSVINTTSLLQVTTNTAGQYIAWLFGPHRNNAVTVPNLTPLIGVGGVGTDSPTTTWGALYDPIVGGYVAGAANVQLHKLTVTIMCTSTPLSASGSVTVGSFDGRVRRTGYAGWNDLAASFITRTGSQTFTAASVCINPIGILASPLDMAEWCTMSEFTTGPASAADNLATDTLSVPYVVFQPTSAAVNYTISVHAQWRVVYASSQVELYSTMRDHGSVSQTVWSWIRHAAVDAAAVLSGNPQAQFMLGNAAGQVARSGLSRLSALPFSRALPALGM